MTGPEITHPDYDAFADAWKLVRDCLAGSRAVKAEGERYLPRLHQQPQDSYDAYVKRANFFNACERTLQALTGFIFRNNPEQKVPAEMAPFMKDATMTGKSFYDVEKETVGAALSVGRRGTLVDWQEFPEDRAFILTYETEDIVNWRFGRIAGKTVLTLLVLREMSNEWIPLTAADKAPNQFDSKQYEQYRIYEVKIDDGERPYVQVTVQRRKAVKDAANPTTSDWVTVDQKIPTRRGKSLQRIPFVPHGPETNELSPKKVPLESIAELNIAHYQTSADHRNALHVAGQPTPVLVGFGIEKAAEAYLGSSHALVSDNANAKATFLSYDAQQASGLSQELKDLQSQMAAQGARILERQGSGGNQQEAYETVLLRQGADMSALMSATIACTQSLSDVLQWVSWWMRADVEQPEDLDDKVLTELNTEFIETLMDSNMLRELWSVYMGGGISYDTLFERLQKGGIVSSERKMEEEIRAIENSPIAKPDDTDDLGAGDRDKKKPDDEGTGKEETE